jgi:SIR2-like domain/Asparaginase, N-terminal
MKERASVFRHFAQPFPSSSGNLCDLENARQMRHTPASRKEVPTWWGNKTFVSFYEQYHAARADALFFIGSGLSRSMGLPSWLELLQRLLDDYLDLDLEPREGSSDRVASVKGHLQAGSAAGFGHAGLELKELYDARDPKLWRRQLTDIFDAPHLKTQPSALHDALVSLPCKVMFTTNYDGLIEYAFRRSPQNPNLRVLYPPAMDPEVLRSPHNQPTLIKLHGSILPDHHGSDLILTSAEYQNFYESDPYRPHREILQHTLKGVSVTLFLGYSHSDEDVRRLFNDSLRVFKDSRLFAVVPRKIRAEFPTELERLSQQWNVGFIPISRRAAYKELEDLLTYLTLDDEERDEFDAACRRLIDARRPTVILLYGGGTISAERRNTHDKNVSVLEFTPQTTRFSDELEQERERIASGYRSSLNSVDPLELDLIWEIVDPNVQMFSENANPDTWNGIVAALERVTFKYFLAPQMLSSPEMIFTKDVYDIFERERSEYALARNSEFFDKDFLEVVTGRYILGIILTFGTDTLAYLAGALALSLRELPCPIVITGANRAPHDVELQNFDALHSTSDAWVNYWNSLYFLQAFGHRYCEVFVSFGETIHHGLNLRKRAREIIPVVSDAALAEPEPFMFRNVSLYGQYMFRLIDGLFVNNYYSDLLHRHMPLLNDSHYRHLRGSVIENYRPMLWKRFSRAVVYLNINPAFSLGDIDAAVQSLVTGGIRAVLVEGYASGTHPTVSSHNFASFLRLLDEHGMPTFLISNYGIRPSQERYQELTIDGKIRSVMRLFGIVGETALPLLSLVLDEEFISPADWRCKGATGSQLTERRCRLIEQRINRFLDDPNIINVELQHITDRNLMRIAVEEMRRHDRGRQELDKDEFAGVGETRHDSDDILELLLGSTMVSHEEVGAAPDGLLALASLGARIGATDAKRILAEYPRELGGIRFFARAHSQQERMMKNVRAGVAELVGKLESRFAAFKIKVTTPSRPAISSRGVFSVGFVVNRGEMVRHERKYMAEAYSDAEASFFAALRSGESEAGLRAKFDELYSRSWFSSQMGKGIDWFIVGYLKGGIAWCIGKHLVFGPLAERLNQNVVTAGLLAAFRRALRAIPLTLDSHSFGVEFRYQGELLAPARRQGGGGDPRAHA